MNKFKLYVVLLAIWNVILFYGNSYGISVILFIIPLLIYLYRILKYNKKINNKKGLLLMIPIIMLSLTYFIFNNEEFKALNFIVIIGLIALMYIITIKDTYEFKTLFEDMFITIFEPITLLGDFFKEMFPKRKNKIKVSDKTKRVLKSILIALPLVVIVLLLLSSADMIFGNIFTKFFSLFKFKLELDLFWKIVGRVISFVFVMTLLGTSCMFISKSYGEKKEEIVKPDTKKDLLSLKIIFIALNIIYVIFDFIQIKSLMLHSISMSGITYAEYARQGFFQLMFVSIINITLILISKKFENNSNKKEFNLIKIMSVIMMALTVVIVISSFLRMNLYESVYGYTVLRLLVYITLITELILMIPTIIYIFNSKFNIVKSYMVIIIVVYIITNYMNIDYVIAKRNIDRYYENGKIDVDYLMNYNTDNVSLLIDLFNNIDSSEKKDDLNNYFYYMRDDLKDQNIFEYNISKSKAYDKIKNLKIKEPEYRNFYD